MFFCQQRSAFSLLELSIVLVILGLLAGGVMSGQSLIRSAQLRSMLTDREQWVTAVHTFKDKYFGLPGDINTATQIWGLAGAGVGCASIDSGDKRTCDGDASTTIDAFIGNGGPSATASVEVSRFWQHLSNAELIPGLYSGLSGTYGVGKFTKQWSVQYMGQQNGSVMWFDGAYGHTLKTPLNVVTPQEMWNIDSKIDDGKPAIGNVVVMLSPVTTLCVDTTSNSNMAAQYVTTSTDKTCGAIFRNQF